MKIPSIFSHTLLKYCCVAIWPMMLMAHLAIGQSLETDYRGLEALYTATDGDNWTNNDNWTFTAVPTENELSSWYGIHVSSGRVLEILLSGNNLTGTIPVEIGDLSSLDRLILPRNSLAGGIPAEIGDLQQLTVLGLDENSLTGELPAEIGNLQQLQILDVYGNSFTGELPAEIGNLQQLEELVLTRNSFDGSLPEEIGNLQQLNRFTLDGNAFTGELPSSLTQLGQLGLFSFHGQDLCAPEDAAFQTWLDGVQAVSGPNCGELQLGVPSISGQDTPSYTIEIPEASGGMPPYTYTVTSALPEGLAFDASTRTISGIPTAAVPLQTHKYKAVDSDGTDTSMRFIIEFESVVFQDMIDDQSLTINQSIAPIMFPEAFGGVAPYLYTLTPTLPEGLVFNASTRTIGGTPTTTMPKTTYTYEAEDNTGNRSSLTFMLEVVQAVAFQGGVDHQSLARGQSMVPVTFPEVSGGVAPIMYDLTPTLLEGLGFDTNTRVLSGTPSTVTGQPQPYKYRATDVNGSSDSLLFTIEVFSPVASEQVSVPEFFVVHDNYPNPFRTSTRLVFDLPQPARVTVEVMDITGRRVLTVPAQTLSAGWKHSLLLDGQGLPSGLYLYRLIAASPKENFMHAGSFVRLK